MAMSWCLLQLTSCKIDNFLMPLSFAERLLSNADNSIANINFKAQPCIKRHVTASADLDSGENMFSGSQARLPSDSEDDFDSGNGGKNAEYGTFFRREIAGNTLNDLISLPINKTTTSTNEMQFSSPGEGKHKLFQLLKDPFWSDQVVEHRHRRQVPTVYKEIKLVQFLQDSSWIREVIADHDKRLPCTPIVVHCKSKHTNKTPRVCTENKTGGSQRNQNHDSERKRNMAEPRPTSQTCNFLPLNLSPIRKRKRFDPVPTQKY